MGSSDFYESTAKYHSSSVAKAVVSPKVDEMEAGAVTTTMIVSFSSSFPPDKADKAGGGARTYSERI